MCFTRLSCLQKLLEIWCNAYLMWVFLFLHRYELKDAMSVAI